MSAQLTLQEAQNALLPVLFGDLTEAKFTAALNEGLARLYDAGKWEGLVGVIEFENPQGFITLPRRYSSILGIQLGDRPRSITSRYFEYSTSGPGNLDEGVGIKLVIDQGMSPTFGVFTGPATLTMTAPVDTGITVRVFGIDQNGKEIFDAAGAPGVLLSHGVESTVQFSEITAVSKPETKGFVTLSSGSDTLSVYEPNETSPAYHRYKVGTADDRTFRCLCKRRFVPLVNPTDLVFPGNLGALKMAVLAITAENASLTDKAQEYWALCYNLLNVEKANNRGNAEIRFNVKPFGNAARPFRRFY